MKGCSPCNVNEFIEHAINNLFPLNEYSEGEIKRLTKKFKEEAEDLNINMNDGQLEAMIKRFDQLKDSVPDKDLHKYSLKKLIKLVVSKGYSSLKNGDTEDPEDVSYDAGGIIVWNGYKREKCILYGKGQKWCITKQDNSNWAGYRYSAGIKYPSFYLVKNTNLPDTDKNSFIVLQVLRDGNYKYTDKSNSPGMSIEMNWDDISRKFPWIADLKGVFKYIPLSPEELIKANREISITAFINEMDFDTQQLHLVARLNPYPNDAFSDISNETFFQKYLPKLNKLQTWIARNPYDSLGVKTLRLIILPCILSFSKENQESILKGLRADTFPIDGSFNEFIEDKKIDFEVKKIIVDKKKYIQHSSIFYYTYEQNIVRISEVSDFKLSILDEDNDYYPNVKINKRTEKYILKCPDFSKISIDTLNKLIEDKGLSEDFKKEVFKLINLSDSVNKYRKEINGIEYFFDLDSFTVGKISAATFDFLKGEELQNPDIKSELQSKIYSGSSFLETITNLIDFNKISFDKLKAIIDKIKYIELGTKDAPEVLAPNRDLTFIWLVGSRFQSLGRHKVFSSNHPYGIIRTGAPLGERTIYSDYLRAKNINVGIDALRSWIRSKVVGIDYVDTYKFLTYLPLSSDSHLVTNAIIQGAEHIVIINRADPSHSEYISRKSGKLLGYAARGRTTPQARVAAPQQAGPPPGAAAQVGAAPVQNLANIIRRGRGRPAGVPNGPRAQVQPQVAPPGALTTSAVLTNFGLAPNNLNAHPGLRRFMNVPVNRVEIDRSRGATRRNNLLQGTGRVTNAYESGQSSIYIITMNSGRRIASIVVQPGNSHYLVTPISTFFLPNPAVDFGRMIVNNNINEGLKAFIANEYIEAYPEQKEYIKTLLKEYKNETK